MSDKSNPYDAPDTGHVWDESLRELTNQPPKWWMLGFHVSWILVLAYGLIYPMWPMVNTHTKGMTGWTSIKEYKEDLQAIEAKRAKYEDQLPGKSAAAILADDELSNYVVRSAKVLFGDNCAACHGTGGQGNPGFPVLADDDWLFGGSIDKIEESIINGRNGMMPAHGNQLSDTEANELADAVAAGNPSSTPLFQQKGCFACHGMEGTGNPMLGAPDLTDSIWRFAAKDQRESIKYTIVHGVNDPQDPQTRPAEMPKFGGTKLNDTDIKKLAVYVHKLGGGQ
ncbi:MAG: c-type cytochrome [Gammaproteobacteria bacterium]|nr:c-type cytochrome [Gammaproteobacteria bacterium]MCW8839976.1 c-type cytochrome [Gammaproteobacteria bacterium]MCW8927800.1 c-type cytochrome [Gammaproteobacteria bacterium]MCW8958271.1 c-type cytochrome [Gammaproteobacteria bacterium]MCW8972922.1 c-type cytochrome [Gammaproteobacteria bacterium]